MCEITEIVKMLLKREGVITHRKKESMSIEIVKVKQRRRKISREERELFLNLQRMRCCVYRQKEGNINDTLKNIKMM